MDRCPVLRLKRSSFYALSLRTKRFTFLAAPIVAIAILVVPVVSQETPNISADTAIANYGTDSINLQKLTPMFVASVRVRGGLSVSLDLASGCTVIKNAWECSVQNVGGPLYSLLPEAQVNGLLSYGTTDSTIDTSQCPPNGQFLGTLGNWTLVDISGNRFYSFPDLYIIAGGCPNQSASATTTDGSALTLTLKTDASGNLSVTIADKFGNITNNLTTGNPSVSDPFGNVIAGTVTSAVTEPLNPSDPALIETAQNSQKIPTAWKYHDATGVYRNVTLSTGSITLSSSLGCGATEESGGRTVINSINYPDSTSDSFTYYSDGRLKTITLRTGGTITYTYGTMDCTYYIPTSVTRQTSDGTWTYTTAHGTVSSTTTTTVLDPGKNQTVYSFSGLNGTGNLAPVLTQVKVNRNIGTISNPSYSALTTDLICYNGNTSSCVTAWTTYPVTEKQVIHTISGMSSSSQTITYYDGGPASGCANGATNCYNNVTEIDSYDFGASTPTIKESISYGSWNGNACAYVGSNIYGKPCDLKTTSGSNTISESRYTYGPLGFMTQKQEWTGATWLTTTYGSNSNGTVSAAHLPNGQTINYSYAATGSGGCNGLLPTATAININNIQLNTSQTWDCNGGIILTTTDANGYTPPANQYDPMFRATSVTDNVGFTVSTSYTSNSTKTSWSMGNISSATTTSVDGLGRPNNTQTTDGSSYDTVSAFYSFNNGPNFYSETSEPCLEPLGTGCSMTAYNHYNFVDPLGRSISESTNFREVYNSTYTQNDVQVQLVPAPAGENPKTLQTEFDGLGRPKSVCSLEVSAGTACGQVMGGSGILTTFNYSYGNGSSTVSSTRGSQTHVTTYDALGRVISTQTPESGTTTYVYDTGTTVCNSPTPYSNPGYLMETIDNSGVHVCYLRDGLGRVYTTYSPGTSAGPWHNCHSYTYGEYLSQSQTPPSPTGWSSTNDITRIAEAQVDYNCNGNWTPVEWFMYDADGRMTDEWESTPNSGGYYHTTAKYSLNGLFNSLTGVPGYPTYTVNLDTNGRPYSSTWGATTVVNSVSRDAGERPTSVAVGTSGDSDSYTYDPYTGLMTNYTFAVNGKSMSGTQGWNANRTLGSLSIVDTFNSGGSQTCNFGYDDVSRLISDNCASVWSQTFSYDQYDNLTKSGSGSWASGYSQSTNQYQNGASYDLNGRVTYDTVNTYAWDQYGKTTGVISGNNQISCGKAGVCITYDAFNRAVEINIGSAYRQILYGPTGRIAQMNGQTTTSVYLGQPGGGVLYASGNNGATVYYQHSDWLGTKRLGTSLASRSYIFDTAYAPYDEAYDTFGTLTPDFTGDLQDIFAGLFDTPNRELMTNASRWLSPDPAGAGWNQYAYTTNPNSSVDPTGLGDVGSSIEQYEQPDFSFLACMEGCVDPAQEQDLHDEYEAALYGLFLSYSNSGFSADLSASGAITTSDVTGSFYYDDTTPGGSATLTNLNPANDAETMTALVDGIIGVDNNSSLPALSNGGGIASNQSGWKNTATCLLKGAAGGAGGALVVGGLAVGAVALGAPVAVVTGVLGGLAVVGGAALGIDVFQQIRAGNSAGIAYDVGSIAGGVAVGAVGGGAIANGINPGATSGWSPASWIAQRFNPSFGSIGQWLGTGPTAASGGMSAAFAGGGAALLGRGGCQ